MGRLRLYAQTGAIVPWSFADAHLLGVLHVLDQGARLSGSFA